MQFEVEVRSAGSAEVLVRIEREARNAFSLRTLTARLSARCGRGRPRSQHQVARDPKCTTIELSGCSSFSSQIEYNRRHVDELTFWPWNFSSTSACSGRVCGKIFSPRASRC